MPDLHKHMLLNVALRKPPRDPAAVEDWLSRVVTKVRMKVMREPWAGWDDTPGNEGVTGDVILTTSHCSIHTWPLRPFFVMDVYSCRDFDALEVERFLTERMGGYDLQVTDVSAALEYRFADKPIRPEAPATAQA